MTTVTRNYQGHIDSVKATKPNGALTVIHGRGNTNAFNLAAAVMTFGEDPRPRLRIKSVYNIKGANDGANSLVVCSVNNRSRIKKRLTETPEELKAAFVAADLAEDFPEVKETTLNKVYRAFFAEDLYTPLSD